MSASIQILILFAVLVLAVSRGVHLGLAAFLAAAAAALWQGVGFAAAFLIPLKAALSAESILLALVLVLILGLSALMKAAGSMDAAAAAYGVLARSPSFAVMTLPGLVGALPMPGGAGFSAPMVAALDTQGRLNPAERSAANYYFRHVVELVWPLYPSFILTISLSGLSVGTLILLNAYAPFVLIVLGRFFLLRKAFTGPEAGGTTAAARQSLRPFLGAFAPVLIAIAVAVVLAPLLGLVHASAAARRPSLPVDALLHYLPIVLGISAGAIQLVYRHRDKKLRVLRSFFSVSILKTVLMVLGIEAFAGTLTALKIAPAIAGELGAIGLGPLALAFVLPFLAGLVTGVGFGYVGVALPIVLALAGPAGTASYYSTIILAGASGYAGMMLSPLHVCAAVSAGFFSVPLSDTLKRVILPVGAFLALALGYALLFRALAPF